jgi:hypothetical protein
MRPGGCFETPRVSRNCFVTWKNDHQLPSAIFLLEADSALPKLAGTEACGDIDKLAGLDKISLNSPSSFRVRIVNRSSDSVEAEIDRLLCLEFCRMAR